MALPKVDLKSMNADELQDLINQARAIRREKVTPTQKIAAYVESVKKHVDGAQQSIAKLLKAEGVTEARWKAVEDALKALQLDNYKDLAAGVTIRVRTRGRKKSR